MLNKSSMILLLTALSMVFTLPSHAAQYLVTGSGGPGFSSPQEVVTILEKGILPTFDRITKLQAEKKIIAGGLPVGDRAFTFIVEAASNDEVDQLLRDLPAWGALNWQVTPLQSFKARAAKERIILQQLKQMLKQ